MIFNIIRHVTGLKGGINSWNVRQPERNEPPRLTAALIDIFISRKRSGDMTLTFTSPYAKKGNVNDIS